MGAEKVVAFTRAWNAMVLQTMRANQVLALRMLRAAGPAATSASSAMAIGEAVQAAAVGILGKGLAPVHRTATANARRLARVKATRRRR